MLKILLPHFLFLTIYLQSFSQPYLGAVYFNNKSENIELLSSPELFLGDDAIDRRKQFDIPLNESDLPVCKSYLDSLTEAGCSVIYTLKWLNCALISKPSRQFDSLLNFSFVDSVCFLKEHSPDTINQNNINQAYTPLSSFFGKSENIHTYHNSQWMYEKGLTGKGVKVAVIDGGFLNTDSLDVFQHLFEENHLLLADDVTEFNTSIYSSDRHGTAVLSLMASKQANTFIGTAPDADYILLRSEVANYENPIEEYHWIRAAEIADSAGAQVINSSLGYFYFDDSTFNHSFSQLADYSTVISRGVKMASDKGILVVTSSGNEGNKKWIKTTFPGNTLEALTVGASTPDSSIASFSSRGTNGADYYKPDVYAFGKSVNVLRANGRIGPGNGTSYASPIIAGYAACLMQAFPKSRPDEIKKAIMQSAHYALKPDSINGHGIPNIQKAYELLNKERKAKKASMRIFPNPVQSSFTFELNSQQSDSLILELNSIDGKRLKTWQLGENTALFNRYTFKLDLAKGIYWLVARHNGHTESFKLIYN